MSTGYFITGTDTDVGKTVATCALLSACAARGQRVVAMKPIAAGGWPVADGQIDCADVLAHAACANVALPRALVNPYAFISAISPHLAARDAGVRIDFDHLLACYAALGAQAELIFVEGAGGWYAPVDETRTMAELAQAMALPVILVVGMRLGCLNHARLSVEAIAAAGLPLAGWVANCVDPLFARPKDNIDYLMQHIPAPLLGIIPHQCIDEKIKYNQIAIELFSL